jgi:hypothetical protein
MQTSLSGVKGRLGVVAVMSALVFGVAVMVTQSTAAAQQGPTERCEGEVSSFPTPRYEDSSTALLYPQRLTKTIDLANPLPAGTYGVNTVTYNGDSNRDTDHGQHQEIIFLSFLDVDGNVLATTAKTEDLEDYVLEATGYFDVGEVQLAAEATQVRAEHGATEATSKHSVSPVCVGVVPVHVQGTTTTARQSSTITPSTTKTTTTSKDRPPPKVATSVRSQTTVQPPPPTEPPGTSPPAPTVVATPRFTG